MVMIVEIEIVTEGGDELENIITYIVIIITYIVIITSYPSSLLICMNIKHYIHHHYSLYVSISNKISITNLKLIDTSWRILQCSSQHLFRSHSIVLDCSDENGILREITYAALTHYCKYHHHHHHHHNHHNHHKQLDHLYRHHNYHNHHHQHHSYQHHNHNHH